MHVSMPDKQLSTYSIYPICSDVAIEDSATLLHAFDSFKYVPQSTISMGSK